jgi:hypothetical protein
MKEKGNFAVPYYEEVIKTAEITADTGYMTVCDGCYNLWDAWDEGKIKTLDKAYLASYDYVI